ncbi:MULTISPECIES: hypothetical protein [unclassified Tenacibaculum]|uniref:hypothetical protein n=1 Tax=unclassified Tenacibaculum TaxID=2635139 RepID=UPI001F334C09|nr:MULTISPECIES: hypothetical protein [unclassified Tenacibaculum]MCF2874858.1 hypothetical protein [Tenacibaculum sp. Cn5-1]MCF2934076.1 hypothetical protein [Tenacibaculum sp. Cn5-34]MCG7510286.1 hypothetical protein [Tenacibaculum sp. Cn5-46]
MKKLTLIIFTIILASCSVDDPNYQFKLLTIKEATVPQSFKFGEVDTVKVVYDLPNSCHEFHSVYYQYQDTTRIIAIRALEILDENCAQATIEKELKIPVRISQKEDYLFKFWKGKGNNGEDIFEEKAVPVN